MSRIGRMPIEIPQGIKADLKDGEITLDGPSGKLTQSIHPNVSVEIKDNKILVSRKAEDPFNKSLHGLHQRLIKNMVVGITKGFQKDLEISGVGYKAKMEGKSLIMQLGFSHPVKFDSPDGIKISVADNVNITVSGMDKQLVGEVAAVIRRYLPPEPYKGKGIKYKGEYIRRKAGKAAVAKGTGAGSGGGAK